MHNHKDVMLDLETMGNNPESPIIAIGAVSFNKNGIGEEFYEVIDLESSISAGAVPDASTIMWWMKQSDSARAQFNSNQAIILAEGLRRFTTYLSQFDLKDVRVWGNGAAFDNVILAGAYRMCGQTQPWKFWNDMCYRTIKNMNLNIKIDVRSGTYHNALDDAKTQALHLIRILNHEG